VTDGCHPYREGQVSSGTSFLAALPRHGDIASENLHHHFGKRSQSGIRRLIFGDLYQQNQSGMLTCVPDCFEWTGVLLP